MTNRTKRGLYQVQIRTISLLTLVALLFTTGLSNHVAAQSAGIGLAPEGQTILDAVNQARVDHGLSALGLSPILTQAAQDHVNDVIANGNWGHYGSDGSNVQQRAARAGYPTSSVSENWVAVLDPNRAIGWWMNDWIHRVNILHGQWDEVGVGAAQAGNGYWIVVTDFGSIDGNAAPPMADAAPVTQLTSANDAGARESIPANGEYTIQSGDTLLGIAIRFGLDWQDIALTNDMHEDDLLQIGSVIRLPNLGIAGGSADAARNVVAGKQVHIVRAGETLWTIAARYQSTWQDIAAVNGLGEYDLLQVGQTLKLPASLDEPEATTQASAAGSAASSSEDQTEHESYAPAAASGDASDEGARFVQKSAPTPNSTETYTVRDGDTLLAIALRYDLDWQALAAANDLTEDSYLQIGQSLKLPKAHGGISTANTGGFVGNAPEKLPQSYRIKKGDTVYGIALQYGVNWQELLRVNGLTEDSLLQPGQELQIP